MLYIIIYCLYRKVGEELESILETKYGDPGDQEQIQILNKDLQNLRYFFYNEIFVLKLNSTIKFTNSKGYYLVKKTVLKFLVSKFSKFQLLHLKLKISTHTIQIINII